MPTIIAHGLILKHWVVNVKRSTFLTNFELQECMQQKKVSAKIKTPY